MLGRGGVGCFNQIYSNETSPLILMHLQITNIYSVRIGLSTSSVKHHSEPHIIKNAVMKQSKVLNGDLKPEYHNKKQTGPRWAKQQTLIVGRQTSETDEKTVVT